MDRATFHRNGMLQIRQVDPADVVASGEFRPCSRSGVEDDDASWFGG